MRTYTVTLLHLYFVNLATWVVYTVFQFLKDTKIRVDEKASVFF